jgi:hypothetical protein
MSTVQKNEDVEIEQSEEHADAFAVSEKFIFIYIL